MDGRKVAEFNSKLDTLCINDRESTTNSIFLLHSENINKDTWMHSRIGLTQVRNRYTEQLVLDQK